LFCASKEQTVKMFLQKEQNKYIITAR